MEKSEFLNECGKRLKKVRKTLRMTQDKFSETLGTAKSTYVRYELGEMMPKLQFLANLINKIQVNSNWFLTGSGEMFQREKAGDSFQANPEVFRNQRYIEMLKLMNIPEVEQLMMARLTEIKALFAPEIKAYQEREAGEKNPAPVES
jgi:transcriptional regulator with XRE-family HTH domain